jgi:hypothetical protein
VLRFIQRAARNFYKTPVVLKIVTASSFSDICSDTVGGTDDLFANCFPGKSVPTKSDVPDFVCELFGQFVNPKIFKICPTPNLAKCLAI